jgi:hypothetical protein
MNVTMLNLMTTCQCDARVAVNSPVSPSEFRCLAKKIPLIRREEFRT